MKKILFFLLLGFSLIAGGNVQAQTMGVMVHDTGSTDNGYILFAPVSYTDSYLIDKCGRLMHSWHSAYEPGQSLYLLPDGNLLRSGRIDNNNFIAGGRGGIIELMDWDSNVLWSFIVSDSIQCQHHDIRPMPNGNILVVSWDYKSPAEAIVAGRDTAKLDTCLWPEKILELQPIGNDSAEIVWEWRVWDHLVQEYDSTKANYGLVTDHPELINLNFTRPNQLKERDWIHMNSVDYNPYLDQIVMSVHNMNEFWIVDHSTTKAEASGHSGGNSGKGGDLLYRWGNPLVYKHGTVANKKLFGQHSVEWIKPGLPYAGSIILFNNGANRPTGSFSTVDIITTPVDSNGVYNSTLPYLPTALTWTYQATVPATFFSAKVSGSQILTNGHIIACLGDPGKLFEFDELKSTVWKYYVPVGSNGPLTQGSTPIENATFRCTFYPDTFSGFNNHVMTPGLPVELNSAIICELYTGINNTKKNTGATVFPNPSNDYFTVKDIDCITEMILTNLDGQMIRYIKNHKSINTRDLGNGIYLLRIYDCYGSCSYRKVVVSKR